MELFSLIGNSQQLDGGAMFGNAPKALWSRWIKPDKQNRIPLACRCLLVKGLDGRNVLFETGIGAFFEPALRERFAQGARSNFEQRFTADVMVGAMLDVYRQAGSEPTGSES